MPEQPRILFFVHDGRGLGHLRRLSRIAVKLQAANASVLFVTGHRDAGWLLPKSCEYVHLPSLESIEARRSRQWGRKPFLADDARRGWTLREDLLESTLRAFEPHAVVTDYLPLGMSQELVPMIMRDAPFRKYFVLRGILGDPEAIRQNVFTPLAMESLRSYYDMILVASDERIVDVAGEYDLPPEIVKKLSYTGYVTEPLPSAEINALRQARKVPPGRKWAVCSAGGGKDGEDLIRKCWDLAVMYPEFYFDIIVGPRSRLSVAHNESYGGDRIRLRQQDERLTPYLHAAADIVILRGGYNSLMEACLGNAHIIVAPIRTDIEQQTHPRRLAPYRPMAVANDLEDLEPALQEALHRPPLPSLFSRNLNTQGAGEAARLMLADLNQSILRHPPNAIQSPAACVS